MDDAGDGPSPPEMRPEGPPTTPVAAPTPAAHLLRHEGREAGHLPQEGAGPEGHVDAVREQLVREFVGARSKLVDAGGGPGRGEDATLGRIRAAQRERFRLRAIRIKDSHGWQQSARPWRRG